MEEHATALAKDGWSRFAGVTFDVTERKNADDLRDRQTEELRRSNAELEQFAYVASHDLKEPLRVAGNYLSLLVRRFAAQLPDPARGYVEHIEQSNTRMSRLVDDLLSYSRVGRATDPAESVPIGEVVSQVREVLEDEIARANVELRVQAMPVVRAELTKMLQLFQNLIGNAIKFRARDRRPIVEVRAQVESDRCVFAVIDNGIGVEPQYAQRIFEVFQRLHRREDYPGTGIGLAICKRIVEHMGGTISVEPTPGGGSTFRFAFASSFVVASAT